MIKLPALISCGAEEWAAIDVVGNDPLALLPIVVPDFKRVLFTCCTLVLVRFNCGKDVCNVDWFEDDEAKAAEEVENVEDELEGKTNQWNYSLIDSLIN